MLEARRPDVPPGSNPFVSIREATARDVSAIATVHVASWRKAYRDILDRRMIEARSFDVRVDQWTNALNQPERTTFLAEDQTGTVVGFSSALALADRSEGFDSYLQSLYLAPEATRRGIGRRLLRAVAGELLDRGCRNMALRVLRENPARGFYESLGARLTARDISLDSGTFDDVVYEFPELRTLL